MEPIVKWKDSSWIFEALELWKKELVTIIDNNNEMGVPLKECWE